MPEGGLPRGHGAVRRPDRERPPGPADPGRRGVLADPDPGPLGRRGQPPGQRGRVDQGRVVPLPGPGQVGGGVDLGADGSGVQELAGLVAQPGDLVRLGGDRQGAAAGEVAGDAVSRDGPLDLVQVGPAEALQHVQLGREVACAVALAVGQAGRAEPAVAPAGRPPDPLALQEHDVPVGVPVAGQQRGPQAGEPAAHDDQVRGRVRGEPRPRLGPVRVIEPEDFRLGVGQGREHPDAGSVLHCRPPAHDVGDLAGPAMIVVIRR